MAQKNSGTDGALPLHEVLEEEFKRLHGKLPASYPVASSDPQFRLKAIWRAIHSLQEKRAALCISGGGIRSATFALGVLQGLARCGLLDRFHFLSTVSGGGYIGSWLTAWIHRAKNGLDDVVQNLAQPRTDARPNPEPQQIQNLRSYSNYLTPRLGILSADSWTLAATYLRNLTLNWLVLIPLLGAALTIPWIYISVLMTEPPPVTYLPLVLGGLCLAMGVGFMGLSLPCGGNARPRQSHFLLFCLAPLVLSGVLMTTHWAWFNRYGGKIPACSFLWLTPPHPSVPFIYFGMGLHVVSWLGSLLRTHGFKIKEFIAVVVSGAIGGWLLWLTAQGLFPQPVARAELYDCFAVPLYLILIFMAVTVFAGISSRWTKDEDREWWGRASGWLLAIIAAWIVTSALMVFSGRMLDRAFSWVASTVTAGGIAGVFTLLAGGSSAIPANEKQAGQASPMALILSKLATIAALLFTVLLITVLYIAMALGISALCRFLNVNWNYYAVPMDWVNSYLKVLLFAPCSAVLALTAGLAFFGVAMAYIINPNKFSLHAMYRDRLVRAYLGASNPDRQPNPFTGFDEKDNFSMHELWQDAKSRGRLMPVINIALNLVGGSRLAWQERMATSFTVSPLHCGSCDVGYRRAATADGKFYGGHDGISLGTAFTISGAAASPNMGYHSSPLVAFLLTLLNVRLGAWLGNPGPAGKDTFQLGYPNFSVGPIIAEAFGLTNDTSPYVYLSDGGHFENLGLYEMVLRRCHFIVVSDAGQDPDCSFSDLGEAVRKIRIDLGIAIEFDDICIYSRCDDEAQNLKGRNCAVGRICYSQVDGEDDAAVEDGVLIYLKPACYGNEPRDIYEYFKRNKTFPHESTGDQFFSESQFESYRMLGAHTMGKLCTGVVENFPDFIRAIYTNHLVVPIPPWLEKLLGPPPVIITGKTETGLAGAATFTNSALPSESLTPQNPPSSS